MSSAPDVLTGLERYLQRGIAGGEVVGYSIYDNPLVAEGAATELAIGSQARVVQAWNHSDEHEKISSEVSSKGLIHCWT